LKGEKRVILIMSLIVGSLLASSYIMFLGFNEAIGNPFVTVLVIVLIWIVGLVGLWLKFKQMGWM